MSYKGPVVANCSSHTNIHVRKTQQQCHNSLYVCLHNYSLPVWQDVRNGDTTCSRCRATLPCENQFLTFGGYNSRAGQLYTKLGLTRTLYLSEAAQQLLIFEAAILSEVSAEYYLVGYCGYTYLISRPIEEQ